MNKTVNSLAAVCFLLFAAAPVWGRVYSLRPGGDSVRSGGYPEEALNAKTVFTEPVTINGVKAELNVGFVDMRLADLLRLLKRDFPLARFAANNTSLRLVLKGKDGGSRRLLLVCFGPRFPIIQFSLILPRKLPSRFSWPDALPMTGDGVPLKCMYFPKRGAWYGFFKTASPPDMALSEIGRRLAADGWLATSGEAGRGRSSRGEIFMHKRPLKVMLVNFTKGFGTVYTRKIKP